MAIEKGFKQTDVGVIPNDWQVRSIQEISNPVRGGSPRPAGDPRFFEGTFIPWLTVAALTNIPSSQLKVSKTDSCLTEEGSLRSRILYPGTLILANSGATLGVAKILDIKCCANDGIAALLNFNPAISTTYLVHYINTRTQYLRDVVATGNGQPNLNTELIGNFKVPFPPTLREQEAIAGALSDADAWIESLEQLIAKKRQIKQGAMQELLTGKRRLPGFSGKWETKRLGDLLSFQVGFPFISSHFNDSSIGLRLIKNRDLKSDDQVFYYDGPYGDQFIVRNGDVLIGMDGDFVPCWWDRGESLLNQRVGRVIPRPGLDLSFAYYALIKPLKQIESVTASTTVKHLSHGDVEGIEMDIPVLKEQTAIAIVLSDMDTEIESLESKLVKAREVKQGMMQELLTGRIRLIEN